MRASLTALRGGAGGCGTTRTRIRCGLVYPHPTIGPLYGPIPQASLLRRLGIELRLGRLLERAAPEQRPLLASGCARLIDSEQMGELFKAIAITPSGVPQPPGFLIEEQFRP